MFAVIRSSCALTLRSLMYPLCMGCCFEDGLRDSVNMRLSLFIGCVQGHAALQGHEDGNADLAWLM